MSLSRAAWNNICRKLQEQEDVIPDTDTRWCCIILCDGTWNAFWTAENCAGICSSAEWDFQILCRLWTSSDLLLLANPCIASLHSMSVPASECEHVLHPQLICQFFFLMELHNFNG